MLRILREAMHYRDRPPPPPFSSPTHTRLMPGWTVFFMFLFILRSSMRYSLSACDSSLTASTCPRALLKASHNASSSCFLISAYTAHAEVDPSVNVALSFR